MKPAIRIENLSKQYRLGLVGTGTLSHDLKRWWHLLRGKEDPYLKIGETNDRATKGNSQYVWALKDINLEVMPGEVLGIIGKNGAGKSTLLKILSKVTGPTTGKIDYKGRIGSLLEVGTGFHPELTGRENIYLNGAILGMRKKEIDHKFDEIVDFSGVERYIDTPTKRYSSGMTVRLGFAVAAFLEPEILVVDEVLAVGDAEFQKKAIGKMQDVSKNEGRTVLFVSHNMQSIMSLCESCILLSNGKLQDIGFVNEIIDKYLSIDDVMNKYEMKEQTGLHVFLSKASIEYKSKKEVLFNCNIQSEINTKCSIDFRFKTKNGISVGFGSVGAFNESDMVYLYEGENFFSFQIDVDKWALGKYFVSIDLTIPDVKYFQKLDDIIMFEVLRNSDQDRRCLDLNWNYGAMQVNINNINKNV